MNPSEIADWDLLRIHNVVYVPGEGDSEFVDINGRLIKTFGNRRYHGLVLKISGEAVYTIDRRYAVTTEAGSLAYLPMGQPYTVESIQPGPCFCVNFFIRQETALPAFAFPVRNYHKWYSSFSELLHAWNYRQPGHRAHVFSIVYDMFATVVEDSAAQYLPSRQKNVIQQLVSGLDNESSACSVTELARQCGMSETYFRRIFRSIYGTSPKKYLSDARFRQARILLTTTDLPIARIAELCGFENVYTFSRAFRTHEGVSPTEYRQNNPG